MIDQQSQPVDCIDPDRHRTLVSEIAEGRSRITISPSIACQFYLRVPLTEIRAKSAEDARQAKTLVFGCLIAAYLLLASTIYLTVNSEGWTSVIYVPVGGIIWSIIAGFMNTSDEFRHLTQILSVCALAALANYSIHIDSSGDLIVLLYAVSLWLHRMAYVGASRSLRQLVLKSATAF